jgi:hypothetical protein
MDLTVPKVAHYILILFIYRSIAFINENSVSEEVLFEYINRGTVNTKDPTTSAISKVDNGFSTCTVFVFVGYRACDLDFQDWSGLLASVYTLRE